MKIYLVFSASYANILREAKVRILVNYATLGRKGQIEIPRGFSEVLIDSGGYQLQVNVQSTRTPSVDAYSLWLVTEVLPNHPEVVGYFNLDILGDGVKTLENQFIMESYGLKPIPIWHLGEGEEYLEYYYQNYEYISVGGLVAGKSSKKELRMLTSLLTQKYPGRKYHFFGIGITGTSVFKEARPYSVDFSTWSNPARFGNEIALDPKQLLKEVSLPDEIKDRIRGKNYDKELLYQYLRESVERIKSLEETIESIHDPEYQKIMF